MLIKKKKVGKIYSMKFPKVRIFSYKKEDLSLNLTMCVVRCHFHRTLLGPGTHSARHLLIFDFYLLFTSTITEYCISFHRFLE